jgi:hypothetical protein
MHLSLNRTPVAAITRATGAAMAIGRAVWHRELDDGPLSSDWGRRLWRWRHWVLFFLALVAGTFATISLVQDPPEEAPITTSYLPAPEPTAP